jgi:hypothetical protein
MMQAGPKSLRALLELGDQSPDDIIPSRVTVGDGRAPPLVAATRDLAVAADMAAISPADRPARRN